MSTINIPCPACGQTLKIRDRNLLGRKGKCPKCSHSFVLEEPAEVELQLAASSPAPGTQHWAPPAGAPSVAVSAAQALPVATSGVGRLREIRKQNSKRKWLNLLLGLFVVTGAGSGGYFLYMAQQQAKQQIAAADAAADAADRPIARAAVADAPSGVSVSPTDGEPISLRLVPAGARTLVHLRPSELWEAGSPGEEFRYCLGPLGIFIDQQIQALCKQPPANIEELLFAWIPGQRGTPPDLAIVVHLKNELKKSDLLDILGGQVVDTYGHPVYISGDQAGVIVDLKTYALGPAAMAEEMVNSIKGQNPMPTGIESLIAETDRMRHITVVFEPTAVLLDGEFMAPASAQPFLTQFMDWFGNDAETVVWSAHLEGDRFYSEIMVRNNTTVGSGLLENRLREKLDSLPQELLAATRLMQPREQGKRQIIGRVPAMASVFSMATLMEHGPRHVRLTTPLPDRAAPNLALGTLLAWDESTRTDFSRTPPPMSTEPSNLPATVAERLRQSIDIDFRRTPLQEAFAYIGDETKVTFDIDGDALKLAGYTQNMPQTFKLDQVPATTALTEILKQYKYMCIVLDESKKTAIVMTFAIAEQKGLTPLPLTPPPQ